MSLSNALQIGRTGILASQTGLEVIGNNLANVSTPGYHRQTVSLTPVQTGNLSGGMLVGSGVSVETITRHVSEALESRIRGGISDRSASLVQQDVLAQVEALENEFTEIDLSTNLSEFFDAWSEVANTPDDSSKRTLVVEQGRKLASFVQDLRSNMVSLRDQVDESLNAAVASASDVLGRLSVINNEVARVENISGQANGLRDERDALLAELSQYVDISTVEQSDGKVDVFVGSIPLVLNGTNRGIELKRTPNGNDMTLELVLGVDGSPLPATAGEIKGLLDARQKHVNGAIAQLDDFAGNLIYQVNLLHSQGQGTTGFESVTGTTRFDNAAAVLNSADAMLAFNVKHGSFQVHLTQAETGQRVTSTIDVDLDGIDPTNDATLNSIAAALNNVDNLNASVTAGGQLVLQTSGPDFKLSFSDDSSGFLAVAGINTFFAGIDGATIDINNRVSGDPGKVAVTQGHVPGGNTNALALADLRSQSLSSLGGISLTEQWNRHVEEFAGRLGQARSAFGADEIVQSSLNAQQQAISGVNSDEEAINLLSYQRAFQGSARFLSVVDEMMQTILGLI